MLEAKKITQLIEYQSEANSNKISIVYSDTHLTYQELNSKANQFAHYLISLGVHSGDIIPIVSSKSINALVALLGILKTGAAYSPLNTESSKNHLEVVFKETKANFVCAESALINQIDFKDTAFINLDKINLLTESFSNANIQGLTSESDLAYVIYTSGTTGNPKGGMIAHANLLPTFFSWQEAYELTSSDIHLQMASFGFDVFAGDWIRALCSGATLVLCPKETLLDPQKLYELIVREKVNCAEFVPAILKQLISFVEKNTLSLSQFRLLICGSDQWTMKEYRFVKTFCGESTRLISSYGLTETTIDSSFFEEEKITDESLPDNALVPIGKPFKHVKLYLINEANQLAAIGEIGEIYIGGEGVGMGYLNRPELTSQRFVSNMIPEIPELRLYKTGDQGSTLPDGNFLFLGRNQGHVKINGVRVDIPALEAVINEHPKVKFALVIPVSKEGSNENISLQCFMSLKDHSLSFEEITQFIKDRTPCCSVPRKFYEVESIPLSVNGKVDKRLSSQKVINEFKPKLKLPKDDIQQALLDIWKGILAVEEIGVDSNFYYHLGGSSLLYVAMLNEVNTRFKLNLSPKDNFETIEHLSIYIETHKSVKRTPKPCKSIEQSDYKNYSPSSWFSCPFNSHRFPYSPKQAVPTNFKTSPLVPNNTPTLRFFNSLKASEPTLTKIIHRPNIKFIF